MLSFVALVALSAADPAPPAPSPAPSPASSQSSPIAAAFASRPVKAPAAAPLVKRNALVVMEFVRGPLSIIAEGRALSAGGEGEFVKILNTSSKTTVNALVIGENRVRVSP